MDGKDLIVEVLADEIVAWDNELGPDNQPQASREYKKEYCHGYIIDPNVCVVDLGD
jgi:hypothetical protein